MTTTAPRAGQAHEAHETIQPVLERAADVTRGWWVRGDAPVRLSEAVVPLVDGRAAMLAMCVAFLTARESIWLADWSIYPELRMVRGRDLRAGPDGSPEQRALVERLRAAGLDDAAMALWDTGQLTVRDVLGFAAGRGVAVHVLLWAPFNPLGLMHMVNNPHRARREFAARGIACRLDKSSRSPFHVAQALHQKCAAVDERLGFVGGVDLTVERTGDFDRWDVPAHPYAFPQRSTNRGPAPHPWHDAHVLVTGSASRDIAYNIEQRWNEANYGFWHMLTPPLRHLAERIFSGAIQHQQEALAYETLAATETGASAAPPPPPGVHAVPAPVTPAAFGESEATTDHPKRYMPVQVVRTIPPLTYRFAPEGIQGIAHAYIHAVRRARRFIYLESQYFWLEGYFGTDSWRLGWQSPSMRRLINELAMAAERGVTIAMVLPDHPNVGRHYTGDTIGWLWHQAPHAAEEGRLRFFTLATSTHPAHGKAIYRPIYVHAKVGIIDDTWATLGSANLNSRGMAHDAEINLAVLDSGFARGLRLRLWAEHTGLLAGARTGWPAPAELPLPLALAGEVSTGDRHGPPSSADEVAPLLRLVQPTEYLAEPPERDATVPPSTLTVLDDPLAGLEVLSRQAEENLERMKRGEPLVGQVLPYLRRSAGKADDIPVDLDAGYLDLLVAKREGTRVHRGHRYI